jgi:nuclear pore complex protein Nup85
VNSTFAPSDYLTQIVEYMQRKSRSTTDGNEKEGPGSKVVDYTPALRKLEEVRLALARNLARALVVGFDNPF